MYINQTILIQSLTNHCKTKNYHLSINHQKQSTMNSGKVVLGMLAGLAAGAVLGILFAPDKGSKTRKQIVDKGNDYADDLKAKFDEILEAVTHKFQSAKDEAEEMASKGKSKYEEAKQEMKSAVNDNKKAATSTFNS